MSQELAQFLEAQNKDLTDEVAKLKVEYTEHKSTSLEVEDQLSCLITHCINLSYSLDKAQSELSAAHADSAQNKADAAYYKDKCVQVEESIMRPGLESPGQARWKESSLEHFHQSVQKEMAMRPQGNKLREEGNIGF
eukprot:scaffold90120_cov81-Attheya_sp.AAC.1